MLVRCCSQILLALGLHGGIDHDPDQLRQNIKALGSNLHPEFGWLGKIALVGDGGFSLFEVRPLHKDTPHPPLFGAVRNYRKKFTLLAKLYTGLSDPHSIAASALLKAG